MRPSEREASVVRMEVGWWERGGWVGLCICLLVLLVDDIDTKIDTIVKKF